MSFANFEFPNTNFYNSDLRELISMYKKLVEDYDSIKTMIEEAVRDYDSLIADNKEIHQRMEAIETAMSQLEKKIIAEVNATVDSKVGSAVEYLENENQKLVSEVATYVANINMQINGLTKYVNNAINSIEKKLADTTSVLKTYSDSGDKKIVEYIDEETARIEQQIKDIKIYQGEIIDPVDEQQKSVQETVNNMFYNLKSWALRAVDFSRVGITAEEYDKIGISAWSYDFLAKWYVREKRNVVEQVMKIVNGLNDRIDYVIDLVDSRTKAYSPVSGRFVQLRDLCYELAQLMRGEALEAVEYDSIEITAEEYDDKEISAYVYDWFGRLVLTLGDFAITASDYDSLQLTALEYDMIGMTAIVYDYQAYRVLHSY